MELKGKAAKEFIKKADYNFRHKNGTIKVDYSKLKRILKKAHLD